MFRVRSSIAFPFATWLTPVVQWCFITTAVLVSISAVALEASRGGSLSSDDSFSEDSLDRKLQQAAERALGDKRGTIVVMDPQTGRVRAVVNPEMAFNESLPPGSTLKPFVALAALRAGLIDDESRTACREDYVHDNFHTVCSHPRDLPPLGPTDAIAYSCNYYFGKLGERLDEPKFISTLNEFGFGRKTGVNANEAPGKLVRNGWRPENAIGESDDVLATPIQLITAYSALVNGGHLWTPRRAAARNFNAKLQSDLTIADEQRTTIVKGLRGAVRYGTAESAGLYKLPNYIFGKTGTATQINGFRSQGWFVGFATEPGQIVAEDSKLPATRVGLAVLIFLNKAHGSEAAEAVRPIFEEFSRFRETTIPRRELIAQAKPSKSLVRIRQVSDQTTDSLALEDYVRAVVATEGSTETELEALKALAIASRTYAIRNLGRHEKDGYDFCSTTHCQRYEAINNVSSLVKQAVEQTSGEILRDSVGQVVDSYFSASCGGATANIGSLWNVNAPPYLRGVNDEYCDRGAKHNWTDVISTAQLARALQTDARTNVGHTLHNVSVLRRDETGRAELVTIEGDRRATISGWEFKIIVGRALGWNVLQSSLFEVKRSGANFVFRGHGFGHGLGLCQEGAHAMALRGAGYRQILAKYFPTTKISNEPRAGNADLMWESRGSNSPARSNIFVPSGSRQTLSSENFRISYPATVSRREVEPLLGFLQSARSSLLGRAGSAGLKASLPSLEIFFNETTGDFVGRTGQPPWAAAATKSNRIELQPLETLRRRRIVETTLRHELVHSLIDALGNGRTPRWLGEGLAINFAGEGSMVSRYQPRRQMSVQEIEQTLANPRSAEEMKHAYAAAYAAVKALIRSEGEAKAWQRVTR
jgi:stage II sporulation protein D